MSVRPHLSLVSSQSRAPVFQMCAPGMTAEQQDAATSLMGALLGGRVEIEFLPEAMKDAEPETGLAIWAGTPRAGCIDAPGLGRLLLSLESLNDLGAVWSRFSAMAGTLGHQEILIVGCGQDAPAESDKTLTIWNQSKAFHSELKIDFVGVTDVLQRLLSHPDSLQSVILTGPERLAYQSILLAQLNADRALPALSLNAAPELTFVGTGQPCASSFVGGLALGLRSLGQVRAAQDLWNGHLSLMERRYFSDPEAAQLPYATHVALEVYLHTLRTALGNEAGHRTRHFCFTEDRPESSFAPFLRAV